jgi:hypothetical protein
MDYDIDIEKLLYSSESDWLEFKAEQYPLNEDHQKAELIKDILAFANSHRSSDAYILIGVRENGSNKAVVVGIDEHHDDAMLQQLVNSKVQRPIIFSYKSLNYEGQSIGILHIPVQERRPFYLKNNFNKLKKYDVKIRRGSSTTIADPDEISTMGQGIGILQRPLIKLKTSVVIAPEFDGTSTFLLEVKIENHSTIKVKLESLKFLLTNNMTFIFREDYRGEYNNVGELKPGYSKTFLVDPKLMFKEVDYTKYKLVLINDGIGREYENSSDEFLNCVKSLYEQMTE